MDTANNQLVNALEIKTAYEALQCNVTEDEIAEIMEMCDENGDNQINFTEWAEMIFRYSGPPILGGRPNFTVLKPATIKEIEEPAKANLKEKMEEAARNLAATEAKEKKKRREIAKKKKIKDEKIFSFGVMAQRMGLAKRNKEELAEAFAAKDHEGEGDGGIDYETFLKVLEQVSNPEIENMFKLFDPEVTGRIDYREFVVFLVNIFETDMKEKTRQAFELFDVDDSGGISREELLDILLGTHCTKDEDLVVRKRERIWNYRFKHREKLGEDDEIGVDELLEVTDKFPNVFFPKFNSPQLAKVIAKGKSKTPGKK